MEIVNQIILALALVVGLYHIKRMMTGQVRTGNIFSSSGLQIIRTVLSALFLLLFILEVLKPRFLPNWIYVPQSFWSILSGTVLLIGAMYLRIVAQKTLKDQWSADISLAEKPKLITFGIYGLVRHPIYAAYCLAAPGFLLATGNLAVCLLAGAYLFVSLLRIPLEERFLQRVFGEEHRLYRERTPGLIIPIPRKK